MEPFSTIIILLSLKVHEGLCFCKWSRRPQVGYCKRWADRALATNLWVCNLLSIAYARNTNVRRSGLGPNQKPSDAQVSKLWIIKKRLKWEGERDYEIKIHLGIFVQIWRGNLVVYGGTMPFGGGLFGSSVRVSGLSYWARLIHNYLLFMHNTWLGLSSYELRVSLIGLRNFLQ